MRIAEKIIRPTTGTNIVYRNGGMDFLYTIHKRIFCLDIRVIIVLQNRVKDFSKIVENMIRFSKAKGKLDKMRLFAVLY